MPQRNAKKVVLLRHFTIHFQKYHVYFLTFSPDGDRRAAARPAQQVISVSRGCFTNCILLRREGVLLRLLYKFYSILRQNRREQPMCRSQKIRKL